jgi:tetratricopeptide (TPR) repeat protein
LSVGNSAGARQCYQRAFDIQQQLKDPNGMAMEAINLGSAASQQADYAAEREAAQQGLSLARQLNNHFMEAMSLQNLGEAERETGDLPTALQHLTNALSLLEDPTLLSERSGVYADLALTQWKAGDLPQALKSAGEILTLYPQIEGTDDNLHRHLWAAARVLHAAGQSTRAGQALEQTYQAFQSCMNSLPDSDLRQTYSNLHYNRQIAAAHDRGEWS